MEEPTVAEDELHFVRLVLWSYVFWFEASHPASKHVVSLLRTAKPTEARTVEATFRGMQYLRRIRAYNLLRIRTMNTKRRKPSPVS